VKTYTGPLSTTVGMAGVRRLRMDSIAGREGENKILPA